MRIVFAGTPDVAVPALRAIHADPRLDLVGVVTRPDAPLGRKRVLTPSPVAQAAAELGAPVVKAAKLDDAATDEILAMRPELGVIVAYGGLVREPLLSGPRHGWVNLHFSLLPAWRGAAPVQRSLMAGDARTGAAVFQLVPELDAGDVFAALSYEPGAEATAGEVLSALAAEGAPLLADTAAAIGAGTARSVPQEGEPTYAHKLAIADGLLDFSLPSAEVLNRFRGVTPEPGAHTTLGGERFMIRAMGLAGDADPLEPGRLRAAGRRVLVGTGDAPLALETVQPAGKPRMAAADWLRGQRDDVVLGS
ncbi:methionyl-tRNA formyltransferase [Microbacterium indicum]|uniref:methionyl-tRNA formyltransferase n=1 Tax=Microbacterium indicum TaxID=358100 RepID=UPI00048DEE85|nr:methionyl-tRNA formyltransferase [Microbacterium indicum]